MHRIGTFIKTAITQFLHAAEIEEEERAYIEAREYWDRDRDEIWYPESDTVCLSEWCGN